MVLGLPGHEELAFGAIATGGMRVLNKQIVDSLAIPTEWIEAIDAKERRELERRERAYRGDRPPPDLGGRTVILVDDRLATGSTPIGDAPRIVVWEHNSHIGDARATELGQAGELNVGQLARERHGSNAILVGITTYTGTVTAASDWGGPAERKHVRRALPGSWEEVFHERGVSRFVLDAGSLRGRRLERAIGVVYRPETERISHYFHARLADQFDVVIHMDETSAVEPIERASEWEAGELPQTYPWGV